MPQETWSTRDEPVLAAIVELVDNGAMSVGPHDLVKHTGFDLETVQRALVALAAENPPFFEFSDMTGLDSEIREIENIRNPTGHARRTVRTWPTAETLADRIIAALEQAAAETENEEEAGRLRRAGRWFSAAGRDVLVNVVSTAMTGG